MAVGFQRPDLSSDGSHYVEIPENIFKALVHFFDSSRLLLIGHIKSRDLFVDNFVERFSSSMQWAGKTSR
jgi:hypothetical protein